MISFKINKGILNGTRKSPIEENIKIIKNYLDNFKYIFVMNTEIIDLYV
jgi:hypothetical protein